CGIEPSVDMNPVLLKCESDHHLQVVALGKAVASMSGDAYYEYASQLKPVITGALNRLKEKVDLVILEGAGSPTEANLQSRDLANMFAAKEADAPVLLVGDIDRGGVFASLIGTLDLLLSEDRLRVKGLIINKFRGNLEILKPGLAFIEQKSGLPVLGVLPYLEGLGIAEEDAAVLDSRKKASHAPLKIRIIKFPRISNFDDFQPLEHESVVDLQFIENPENAVDADLLILPGTKSTIADLQWLRARGFEALLQNRVQKGLPVLGVCGGYQMLGETIEDPDQVESKEISISGLGLLPITTRFEKEKVTAQVEAAVLDESSLGTKGLMVKTYEIHMGRVVLKSSAQPLFQVRSRNNQSVTETEGVMKESVIGTLMHGLFENKEVRQALISHLGKRKGLTLLSDVYSKDAEYDRLAEMIQNHLDTRFLDRLVGL
ncbi:MAG TPA: cobyric acid synthase, partial [bacterium]|nr:cobyric acid synthase [bacterium]